MAPPHQRHHRFYWYVLLRPRHVDVRLVVSPPLLPHRRLLHPAGVVWLKPERHPAALLFHADRSKLRGQKAELSRRSHPR